MDRTWKMLSEAEIVLAMLDAADSPAACEALLSSLTERMDFSAQKLVVLVNKIDCNKKVKDINNYVSLVGNKAVVLEISALKGIGLTSLRETLGNLVKDRFSSSSESILVTNSRHHEALRHSAESLSAAQSALEAGLPSDLVAQDLRAALYHLGTITGAVSSDEVLGLVFSRFCIGK